MKMCGAGAVSSTARAEYLSGASGSKASILAFFDLRLAVGWLKLAAEEVEELHEGVEAELDAMALRFLGSIDELERVVSVNEELGALTTFKPFEQPLREFPLRTKQHTTVNKHTEGLSETKGV